MSSEFSTQYPVPSCRYSVRCSKYSAPGTRPSALPTPPAFRSNPAAPAPRRSSFATFGTIFLVAAQPADSGRTSPAVQPAGDRALPGPGPPRRYKLAPVAGKPELRRPAAAPGPRPPPRRRRQSAQGLRTIGRIEPVRRVPLLQRAAKPIDMRQGRNHHRQMAVRVALEFGPQLVEKTAVGLPCGGGRRADANHNVAGPCN